MNYKKTLRILLMILLAAGSIHAQTIILTNAQDTYISSGAATTNNSTATNLIVGPTTSADVRGLFSFDLSIIPTGATITSVSLKVYSIGKDSTSSNSTMTIDLLALTTSFTASQATWNKATSTVDWTTPGGDFNSGAILSTASANPQTIATGAAVTFASTADFIAAVQSSLDGGTAFQALLKLENEDNSVRNIFQFASSENSNTSRYPSLIITYSVPEPGTMALLVLGGIILAIGFGKKSSES